MLVLFFSYAKDVSVYDKQGNVLMPESYVGPFKYEGLVLLKDLDSSTSEPFLVTSELGKMIDFALSWSLDISDLRKREAEVRQQIQFAQIKYARLKEEEVKEQAEKAM